MVIIHFTYPNQFGFSDQLLKMNFNCSDRQLDTKSANESIMFACLINTTLASSNCRPTKHPGQSA